MKPSSLFLSAPAGFLPPGFFLSFVSSLESIRQSKQLQMPENYTANVSKNHKNENKCRGKSRRLWSNAVETKTNAVKNHGKCFIKVLKQKRRLQKAICAYKFKHLN
ncbi:hypothetical protein ACMZ8B_01815 [Gardnerella greenwoodii]